MAVDAAVGEQAHQVQGAVICERLVHRRDDRLVVLELVVVDGLGDSGQLLIDDSACADVGVTDLAVAHLTVGETDVHARRADLGQRVFLEESVEIRRVRRENGVRLFLALFADAEAVKNHQYQRFFHGEKPLSLSNYLLAAFTIAANFSATREAPPIRPPSTLVLERSSSALPSFMEPPYWMVTASAAS